MKPLILFELFGTDTFLVGVRRKDVAEAIEHLLGLPSETEREVADYWEGFRNGQSDFDLGVRSEYAWAGINDTNPYASEYSRGYRMGYRTRTNGTRQ